MLDLELSSDAMDPRQSPVVQKGVRLHISKAASNRMSQEHHQDALVSLPAAYHLPIGLGHVPCITSCQDAILPNARMHIQDLQSTDLSMQ